MDKKNTVLGVVFLAAAVASMVYTARRAPQAPPVPDLANPGAQPAPVTAPAGQPARSPANAMLVAAGADQPPGATLEVLSNDFVTVRLTNMGGAILDVALKKYAAEKVTPGVPYVINQLHADPALAFVDLTGLDRNQAYQVERTSDHEVVYRTTFNQFEVVRRYRLPAPGATDGDPYQIRHETTFRNLTDQPLQLPRLALSAGTAAPYGTHETGQYLATAYNADDDVTFISRNALEGGGFLAFFGLADGTPKPSIPTAGPLRWISVNNQFFTSILTPDQPALGFSTQRVNLYPQRDPADRNAYGVTGIVNLGGGNLEILQPRGEATLGLSYYTGPKEYRRLANNDFFKAEQSEVMQFGMLLFKLCAQLLQWLMNWWHQVIPNWGIAIVLTTLSLKIVFLYPTLSASKSAKRMQKIQPEFQALREKYKDNPRKMQTETMELYKRHGVNPLGGCLPILFTMPFFIGFFSMLSSTAELRFAEFLWVKDLSAPDTVATLYGIPLNIMPLLLGATMVVQMRLTPMPTADKMQATLFKFMPWVFMIFCYNFSAALSLYSTINGLFTIGQQMVVNRMKDTVPTPVASTDSRTGRPTKNVTPKRTK